MPMNKSIIYDEKIRFYANKHSIPYAMFKALIGQESGFDPNALSPCGAMGLCQLMPATARLLGVTDPSDVEQNLNGGAKHLRAMYRIFACERGIERWRFALGAYNCGAGYVIKAQHHAKIGKAKTYKWYHIVLFLERTGCDFLQTSEYVDKIILQMFEYIYEDIKLNGGGTNEKVIPD